MAQSLKAEKIVSTLEQLERRISERFPQSGLLSVCHELVTTSRATRRRASRISRPNLLLRLVLMAFLTFAGLALVQLGAGVIEAMLAGGSGAVSAEAAASMGASDFAQALEAGANLAILAAAGIYFLVSLEERIKRRQILKHLHELRSLAHVVDMHQLTKDPVTIINGGSPTESSPKRDLTAYQLGRYLDYCSEMLALIGKLAALYGEQSQDAQVVGAVNDIETLTTGLGRKIWQKITMIDSEKPPASTLTG